MTDSREIFFLSKPSTYCVETSMDVYDLHQGVPISVLSESEVHTLPPATSSARFAPLYRVFVSTPTLLIVGSRTGVLLLPSFSADYPASTFSFLSSHDAGIRQLSQMHARGRLVHSHHQKKRQKRQKEPAFVTVFEHNRYMCFASSKQSLDLCSAHAQKLGKWGVTIQQR